MNVGIHQFSSTVIYDFERKYQEILAYNGVQNTFLHVSQPDFWDRLKETTLFIGRWIDISDHDQLAHTLLPVIENTHLTECFPTYHNFWSYDDKIRQYYLLRQHGFPVIETYIFWDKQSALNWIETVSLPIVFKLKGGASSSNVVLVKSQRQGVKLVKEMFGSGVKSGKLPTKGNVKFKQFNLRKTIRHWGGNLLKTMSGVEVNVRWRLHKNYALFQHFLPGNTFDVRVTVIGGRAFAFRRFNRENDFRASGSGKIDFEPDKVDTRCISIALNVSEKLKFHTMCYDFLYDNTDNPLISEMSYTFVDKFIHACPGYWDKDLNFHSGNYWPQYLQLVDLLKMPDLKQPDIKIAEEGLAEKLGHLIKAK